MFESKNIFSFFFKAKVEEVNEKNFEDDIVMRKFD